MRIPIHRGRRKTTLPDLPRVSELQGMSDLIKDMWTGQSILNRLHEAQGTFRWNTVDPWDDAIKWLERHEEAKKEWPWP